jgi:predicted Zn-dependent protease
MKLQHLFFIIIFLANVAKANIIRDSEIEEAVNLVVAPLREISGLKDLKIYILDELVPNAFTAGGNEIFITSGLIINYPDPDVLRGVVAHEMGHILGHHVVRRDEVIDNYKKAALGTTALGLATAISGSGGEGLAITLGGIHFSERSIYAYSREFESSADQTAMRLLNKSSNSVVGLIKFFEKMQLQSTDDSFNQYDQTHPLNNERLLILRNFNKKSKFSTSQNNNDIIYKYSRASAKLAAFTVELNKILDYKPKNNVDEITHYMKAIKCFRIGNFNEALSHINFLVTKHPNDPYYHELKAQIYFESGKKAALHEYELAEEGKPNDPLIRLGKAIVGMTNSRGDSGATRYYKDLLFVLDKEPDNLLALHYMAIYYEQSGLIGKSYLNTALISLKSGRISEARKMATMAINNLKKNSPDWYKAGDILEATK